MSGVVAGSVCFGERLEGGALCRRRWCVAAVLGAALMVAACDDTRYSRATVADEARDAPGEGEDVRGSFLCDERHWTRSYRSFDSQNATTVRLWDGGGFVLSGHAEGRDRGFEDAWLLRIDGQGEPQAEFQHDGPDFESSRVVFPSPEGGFIAFGRASYNAYEEDMHMWRADASGQFIDERHYEGPGNDQFLGAVAHPEGGYVLVAWSRLDADRSRSLPWLLHVDDEGVVLGERLVDIGIGRYIERFLVAPDGTLVFGLSLRPPSDGRITTEVLQLNIQGEIVSEWSSDGMFAGMVMSGEQLVVAFKVEEEHASDPWTARLVALERDTSGVLWERDVTPLRPYFATLRPDPDGGLMFGAVVADGEASVQVVQRFNVDGEVVDAYSSPGFETLPDEIVITGGVMWLVARTYNDPEGPPNERVALWLLARDLETGEFLSRERIALGEYLNIPFYDSALLAVDEHGVVLTLSRVASGEGAEVMVVRRDARCLEP